MVKTVCFDDLPARKAYNKGLDEKNRDGEPASVSDNYLKYEKIAMLTT